MKQALVTMIDDNFMIGFEGFYKSFIYHNKWFLQSQIDLIILDNGLSEESKNKILSYNNKAIFRTLKKEKYSAVRFDRTQENLQSTYYKLDIFGIYEYDRLTFIDSDVTVLGDIKKVFEYENIISACATYSPHNDRLNRSINSGVFTINKTAINKVVYHQLIKIATKGHTMPDQRTINIYFSGQMNFMDKEFNVEKRMWKSVDKKKHWENKKILHWVANKPWMTPEEHRNDEEREFFEIYHYWQKYYDMTWEEVLNG